jgi:glucose/arabinose dehydrogenase
MLAAGMITGFAQQSVPFANGIPVAPSGLANRPLPALPLEYDTAEGHRIRVVEVTRALAYPWSIAFLPDGSMLVTERTARLRVIRNGRLDPAPVAGTPTGYFAGESGLPGAVHGYMDLALHPNFASNQLVYMTYTKPLDEKRRTMAIARGRWDGRAMQDMKDIFVADEGTGGSASLAFGRDGALFVTTTGQDPQDPGTQGGKILRLRDDGGIPKDNPFVGRPNHRPEVYSLGHRNSLGLAVHPGTGELWQNENGPNGGDEINIIRPGRNYGWPIVSYGRTYPGPWQSERHWQEGFEMPIVYWMPSIAVSGMTFYTGERFPKWKGDVFVGALRTGEVPGTGHVRASCSTRRWRSCGASRC